MKSILDKGFKYIPSVSTDIKKTFARIRREQAVELVKQCLLSSDVKTNIRRIKP